MQQKFINLLPEWFKSIPHFDKILHAIAGVVVYALSCLMFSYEVSFIPLFIIASLKEYLDNQQKGNFASLADLGATMILPFLWYLIFKIL